jgi:hypothetical protein
MRLLLLCSLLSGSVLAGCGTFVDFTPINDPPHELQPRSTDSVEVFASGPPARQHVDVAIVEAEQTHSLNEQGTGLMIRRMREQAAAIGCDAIVLGGVSDHQGAQPGSGWDLLDPGATKRQATCVVYEDSEPVRPFTATRPPVAEPSRPPTAVRQRVDSEQPGRD